MLYEVITIGSGCGVPGIMASRTIENDRDRKMTIITTTFIPCGAKLPIIALIAGALFDGAWWVAPSAYFTGIAAIVVSGIILKKTKLFAGAPAPFVMELPAYHMPTFVNVMRSMWEIVITSYSIHYTKLYDCNVLVKGELVPLEREIRISDLLTMTSGLVYPDCDEAGSRMQEIFDDIHRKIQNGTPYRTRQIMQKIAESPLAFQPGKRWRYGLSTDVLGGVIEVIAGVTLREFYHKEIFEPLKMTDTDFYVPTENRITSYNVCYTKLLRLKIL